MTKKCKACGKYFQPNPKVPDQQYCSSPKCQRERRRRWQQKTRQIDIDYRDNESRYFKDWAAEHPDYWQRYRNNNPEYAERNRNLQQIRNKKKQEFIIAKGDELLPASGIYRLGLIAPDGAENQQVWLVEIIVISRHRRCEDE